MKTLHFQTAHGRDQRRVLAGSWAVLFGIWAFLTLSDLQPIDWGLWAAALSLVVLGFLIAAVRREHLGLHIDRDSVEAVRIIGRVRTKGPVTEALRDVAQRDYEFVRIVSRNGRAKRVPYLSHVTESSLLRRCYATENHLLIKTPSGTWEPTDLVWRDRGAADFVRGLERLVTESNAETTQ